MKTVYYTRDVWMNRISVQVEPIPGTGFVRVCTFSNEQPDTDAEWVRPADVRMLDYTHLPPEHQLATAVALVWMFDEWDVVRVIISDTRDGWSAEARLYIQNQSYYGRGVAATPADAIRAAKLDAFHKAAR